MKNNLIRRNMRRRIAVFMLGFFFFSFTSLFAQWEPDERLTNDDNFNSYTRLNTTNISTGPGGVVHLVWHDERDGNTEIYYKRSTDDGISWRADTRLTNNPAFSEFPSIGVSGSFVHVVWGDNRDNSKYEIFYKRSTDSGIKWESDRRLTYLPTQLSNLQPSISISGNFVHVVWLDTRISSQYHRVYYKRSTDEGTTWEADMLLSNNTTSVNWIPIVSSYGEYVHVVWSGEDPTGKLYYRRSTDSGTTWEPEKVIGTREIHIPYVSSWSSNVHVVWEQWSLDGYIYYKRSTDNGTTWEPDVRLISYPSTLPQVFAYDSDVHLVWHDSRNGGRVYYKRSTDNGYSWELDKQLSSNYVRYSYPSVSSSGTIAHVVWQNDLQDDNYEIYYRRNPNFNGFMTVPSQGRHLVRDPWSGLLHLVVQREDNMIFYSKSTDNGITWSDLDYLGDGMYPTVGLAYPLNSIDAVICISYKPTAYNNKLIYKWYDPMVSYWQTSDIPTTYNPGPPSLITSVGGRVYVVYKASGITNGQLYCQNFWYDATNFIVETIDVIDNPDQPCLTVDGNGEVHSAWRRQGTNEIWYAPRANGTWGNKLRVDRTTDISQQPFVECYGDSVFVVWSDEEPSPGQSDVWRAAKHLQDDIWQYNNVSKSNSLPSESPTQAWREFTTWSEGTGFGMFDINYWNPNFGTGTVESNPFEWSHWTHSQMWHTPLGTYLMNAWTEKESPYTPPYRVMTKLLYFPILGGEGGSYYSASAGDSIPSHYLRKRDGIIRFRNKSVDYSRNSLVYELPYLDPNYDYYLKVSSYRETGNNWTQGLSVDGSIIKTVQFLPNKVDTAWIQIPPLNYVKDRKIVFSLKNISGDYVTSIGLTLYQRDPKKRVKGGPQSIEQVVFPTREMFAVYPNPMKSHAQIEYNLKTHGQVAVWDGKSESGKLTTSGVYFVRLNTPEKTKTVRLVVVH